MRQIYSMESQIDTARPQMCGSQLGELEQAPLSPFRVLFHSMFCDLQTILLM